MLCYILDEFSIIGKKARLTLDVLIEKGIIEEGKFDELEDFVYSIEKPKGEWESDFDFSLRLSNQQLV